MGGGISVSRANPSGGIPDARRWTGGIPGGGGLPPPEYATVCMSLPDTTAGGEAGRRGASSIGAGAEGDDPRAIAGVPAAAEEPCALAGLAGAADDPLARATRPGVGVDPCAVARIPAPGDDPCAAAGTPDEGVEVRAFCTMPGDEELPELNGGIPATAPLRALGIPMCVSARRASASSARPAGVFSAGRREPCFCCCTTWVSSCARSRRELSLVNGAVPGTCTVSLAVNASALIADA